MYGAIPKSMFLVFCNPGASGDDALGEWYWEVHGPDAIANGSFQALHRYRALDARSPARFLAVWEGEYASLGAAKDHIVPRAAGLRSEGRITGDMSVVWATMQFLRGADPGRAADVRTLTLVNGPVADPPGDAVHRYGDLVLVESSAAPGAVANAWDGIGHPGMAPYPPYRGVFDVAHGDRTGDEPPVIAGTWVSHWEPIGSLTAVGRVR